MSIYCTVEHTRCMILEAIQFTCAPKFIFLRVFNSFMVADHFPDGIYLSQGKYAQEILQCSNMLCSRAVHTPLAQKHGLHEATGSSADSTKYRSIVGALQYLTVTRPELSHAVNLVCQFMQSLYHATFWPKEHFKASLSLVGFSDSDWTGCPINQAFYNRVVCIFGGRIAFPGKQQTVGRHL